MREMLLGDIYWQPPDMTDSVWAVLFNIVNPGWTAIPLFSDFEITVLTGDKS